MFHAIGECQVALREFAPLWIPAFEGWKQSVLTDLWAWHRLLTLLWRPAAEPELRLKDLLRPERKNATKPRRKG